MHRAATPLWQRHRGARIGDLRGGLLWPCRIAWLCGTVRVSCGRAEFSVPRTSKNLRLHDQPRIGSEQPHPAERSALNESATGTRELTRIRNNQGSPQARQRADVPAVNLSLRVRRRRENTRRWRKRSSQRHDVQDRECRLAASGARKGQQTIVERLHGSR
jgi:hypothetical protein